MILKDRRKSKFKSQKAKDSGRDDGARFVSKNKEILIEID